MNTDFRHQQLALAFFPFLIWAGAVAIGISSWHHRWGIPLAVLLFYVGTLFPKKMLSLQYRLASRALPTPLRGSPGRDYLLFEAESPETFHKLRILPEDAGFIYAENECYRITTLKHEYTIPFLAFHCESIKRRESVRALLLRFQPQGMRDTVELAATFKYFGDDLKVAADYNRKCEWATKVIDAMKA